MGAAIGYALAQPAAVTFAVFTALALGLAAPYVALTLQPAWTRVLPKPGAWMDVLKQAVSVPIFATVIWLAWVIAQAYGAALLAALLAELPAARHCRLVPGPLAGQALGDRDCRLLVLVVVALSVLRGTSARCSASGSNAARRVGAEVTRPKVADQSESAGTWQPWSADAVQRALAAGQPVFVDFTASWCLSCQVNERVALDRPEVMQAFAAANVVLLRADWTRQDPAITQALTDLGRSGVPVYALYTPGQTGPQLLPQVLTPGIVIDAVAKLPHGPARE